MTSMEMYFLQFFISDILSGWCILPYRGRLCYTQSMLERDITAVVFEVREFCLHDGPGVRTTVFFKGCPLRCAWCHNPEGLSPEPEVLFKDNRCMHCGNCRNIHGDDLAALARVCPHMAKSVCGRRWTIPELAEELLANSCIFEASGGGITFSGGEPLLQATFLVKLADMLKSRETPPHLAIETSGYVPADSYRAVISRMDLVFQDLKHPDPAAHKRWTGRDPAQIHANLRWLKESGKPFVARIPLIPGVNDSREAKEGFANLLEGPSGLLRVELLPYHLAAAAKYPYVGRTYKPEFDVTRPPDTDIEPFSRHGLAATVM